MPFGSDLPGPPACVLGYVWLFDGATPSLLTVARIFYLSACGCSPLGTLGVCNPKDGKCLCDRNVMGPRCDRCQVGVIVNAKTRFMWSFVCFSIRLLFLFFTRGFVDTCILSHLRFPSFFLVFSLLCPRHFVPSCRQPFLPFYPRPFVCLVVRVFISSFLCVFVSSAFFAFVLSSLRLFGCLCLYFFVPSCLRVLVLSCLIDFVRFSFHF